MIRPLLAAALLACAIPAAAQQPRPASPYDRAIAAGYKAAMYCAGIFTAGRTPAQIDGDELTGIYPEYDAIVPTLHAAVDRDGATVDVAFDPALPPRRALWTSGGGCRLEPIGMKPLGVMNIAPLPGRRAQPDPVGPRPADPRRWPLGDAGIAIDPATRAARTTGGAFDGRYGAGAKTIGVVVLRGGSVVAEQYAPGWGPFVANRTWSVAKSISGTLIGLSGMTAEAPATVPEWDASRLDPRAEITLDNLLRMTSGLHSGAAGNRTDAIYFGGTAVTEEATAWPLEAKPGTRFRYANDDILLAVRAMRATLGSRYDRFPRTLFEPLGMRHTVAEQDWSGNYILSSQVWTTARDLARLGQFWLQDGVWQGKRLLPAGWMAYMRTPRAPQPEGEFGYGATLWLMNRSPGVPADTYAAFGNRGQYVVIVPSRQVVIVRRGEDPGRARFDIAKFTADVLAALP